MLEAPDGDLDLRLRATVDGETLTLDFAGSAAQHAGNLNCPAAVTESACLFAVRVLTDPDIPPTAGAYRPVEVRAPLGSVLNARPGAAVAAGNVETSSRVADLVLSAFGRAQGQGTMNNLSLGNERFSYYETLGGGQGACEDADGPNAVHVAMSNTLNTPIEALEREFPLRVVAVRAAARLGRRRPAPWRRRRGPRAGSARGDELLPDRRAPPSRSARRGGRRRRRARPRHAGRPAAARARQRAPCTPARGCASRPPVEEDSDRERRGGRADRVPGARHHGLADGGQPGAGRPRADRLDAHARQGRGVGRGLRRHGAARRRPQVAAASDIVFSMVVDGAAGRLGPDRSRAARSRQRARGCCASTARRSHPSDSRRIGAALAERGARA